MAILQLKGYNVIHYIIQFFKKSDMSKYINLITKEVYPNRLAAKMAVGTAKFNHYFRYGTIIFLDDATKNLINGIEE